MNENRLLLLFYTSVRIVPNRLIKLINALQKSCKRKICANLLPFKKPFDPDFYLNQCGIPLTKQTMLQ